MNKTLLSTAVLALLSIVPLVAAGELPGPVAEERPAAEAPVCAVEVAEPETPAPAPVVEPVFLAACCTPQDRQWCQQECSPNFGKTVCIFGVCECFCSE